jgi:DNA polymerase III subunit delta
MVEKIINEFKKKIFKPVYWLEGEEDFFIDQVVDYAESKLLSEADAQFNLTIFYGKDAVLNDIINACRRYPMFADKQVVILKEAQQMKDLDKLVGYVKNPLPSTILVVSHKTKKVDGRTDLARALKQHAEVLTTKKMYDSQLPSWVSALVSSKGYSIKPKALALLTDHIGNDLNRIANEVDKVIINLADQKEITEDHIERFVGISKEYNAFELNTALARKDLAKAIRIIQYYESNPKAAPLVLVIGSIYNHFSKVYNTFGMNDKSDAAFKTLFYNNPEAVRLAKDTVMNYSFEGVEKTIMLLHDYNLKSIGINSHAVSDASLMKEMAYKIIYG